MIPPHARLALCLAAAALTGCQGAIGLTGYTFIDTPAGAGGIGGSGAGGTGGSGGGGGMAIGGAAGTGTAGAATCVTSAPVINAGILNSCAYYTGCVYPLKVSFGDCLSSDIVASSLGLGCLSGVTSCNDVYGCVGEALTLPTMCSGVGWSCNVDTSYQCATDSAGDLYAREIDCTRFGGTCNTAGSGDSDPFGRNCILDKASCATNTTPSGCVGSSGQAGGSNSLIDCRDGVAFGQNCDLDVGGVCAISSDGQSAACVSSDKCTNLMANQVTCTDDTHLLTCSPYTTPFSYDCSNANLVCATDTSGSTGALCVPQGCTVEQRLALSCQESCSADGTTANVCVAGVPVAIDCVMATKGACVEEPVTGTGSAKTTAVCRPGTLSTAM